MVDIFTRKKRSEIMRRIGPKNSKPERYVAEVLKSLGYRYVSHHDTILGKPDFAFRRREKAIFVNGCFWHGHSGCLRASLPATNRAFWKKKIASNIRRDHHVYRKLRKSGWGVMVIWQCRLQNTNAKQVGSRIDRFIKG